MDRYSKRMVKCFVPGCRNTSANSRDKLFLSIRESMKWGWFSDAKTMYTPGKRLLCCEDHVDLKEDLENYQEWKMMGTRPVLKPTAKLRNQDIPISKDDSLLKEMLLNPAGPVSSCYQEKTLPSASIHVDVATQYQIWVRAKRKAEALLNPQDRIDDTSAPNPETAGPSQPAGTPLPPANTLAQPDNGTLQNTAHESNPLPAAPPAPLAKRISRPPSDPHLQEIYANHIKVIKKKPIKRKSGEVACSVCSRTLRKTLLRCLQCARVLCGPCDRRRVTACTTQNHVMLRMHSSATYDKLSHLLDEWQRDVVAAVGEPPASDEDEEADTTTIEPTAANLIDDQSLLVPIDNSMSKYMALPVEPPEPNTIPEKPKPFEHPSGRVFRGRKPQNKNDKPKDKTKEPHVDNEPMIYNPVPFQPVVDLFGTEAIKPEPDPLLGLDAAPQGTVAHGQPIGGTTVDGSIPDEGDPGAPPVEVKMEPQELITIEEMDVNVAVADTNVSPSEPYVFELYSSHKPAPS